MKSGAIIRFVIMILLLTSCESRKDENTNAETKDKNTFIQRLISNKKDIKFSDSLELNSFFKKYPEFTPLDKKINKFYSRRNYTLGWYKDSEIIPHAEMLINLIYNQHKHGLPADTSVVKKLKAVYHLSDQNWFLKQDEKTELYKELDFLLTACYFRYSRWQWKGILDPEKPEIEWNTDVKKVKYGKILDSILVDNGTDPFSEYEPQHVEYKALVKYLETYLQIEEQGGWPKVNPKSNFLMPGDRSEDVLLLRKRLAVSGDLKFKNSELFDEELAEAVKDFQTRHGLKPDGVAGGETLKELNVPVSHRIEQILLNMERWRWVPEKINKNYILVNIPEFMLYVYEDDKPVWDMKVIVGKNASRTPVYSDEIKYVVLAPTWNLPPTTIYEEVLPAMKRDSTYLSRHKMEVFTDFSFKNKVDPNNIKWEEANSENFKYVIRQLPGPGNRLGKVKFLFPNEYSIYLHDTPSERLFDQYPRLFSLGCIRLEDPLKLAEYLLNKEDKKWDQKKILNKIYQGKELFIPLKNKIPVYIVYFTTWVDRSGKIHFLKDVYEHDKKLKKILYSKLKEPKNTDKDQ
ncbi:MAG: murein L,D-transpeptidase [Cytophagaceae bacterium]